MFTKSANSIILALFIGNHMFTYNFILFYHSTSTSEHAPIFLKCMVDEHVFMKLVSLNEKSRPR